MWAGEFDAALVHGVELDVELVRMATAAMARHGLARRVVVRQGSALDARAVPPPFDRVVCVDAAYHLSPRADFLQLAFDALKPGGRLAYTDLLRDAAQGDAPGSALPARFARASGIAPDDIVDESRTRQRLAAAGFTDIRIERLDAAVLDGFIRFVRRQSTALGLNSLRAGWRRPLATALVLRAARRRGLGYGLIAANRPLP
jgi:cyclopropane fatty-acyl-phospholipid synthase-like methyltransferase